MTDKSLSDRATFLYPVLCTAEEDAYNNSKGDESIYLH